MANALRGVNLGGWLIAEHLTTPLLFKGVLGRDETSIINELGDEGRDRLRQHHANYINEDDLKWLTEHGINALRIPVPHWVFGDVEPHVGSIDILDMIIKSAHKMGFKILLDLHTAPGSQNGQDHSGVAGSASWHKDPSNIDQTLSVLEKLIRRYPEVWGIELLNEPSPKIPLKVLESFYRDAYHKIRAINDQVLIVMHDAWQPEAWLEFFESSEFNNVALDMHLYHVFDSEDKKLDIHKQLKKVMRRRDLIAKIQATVPCLIGEWSLGLSRAAFRGLDAYEADKARQAFGQLQLNTYDQTMGWFFWTYKTEDLGGWNFRFCVEKGWLPADLSQAVKLDL